MIVISPACTNARVSLQSSHIGEVVRSIGTERYSKACFDVFEQPLEVNTWLLMRYSRDNSVRCVANASRSYALAVSEAIDRFVAGFYSVDPSLLAFRAQRLQSDCVVKIEIGDIRDRQYRYCYNQTHAQERLSFFHGVGSDLYQLSVFRSTGKRPFSPADITNFSALAGFIVATAVKHESFKQLAAGIPRHLELDSIEQLLRCITGSLSDREIQVCARVVAGMTIDRTALDLAIKRTTVVTYRQRAYEKLNITRRNELVALVNNVCFNTAADVGAALAERMQLYTGHPIYSD